MNGSRCAIAAFATVTSILLPVLQASARPVEPDFPCYMQTSTGRIVDLTAKMCGAGNAPKSTAMSAQTSSGSRFLNVSSGNTATDDNSYNPRYRSTRTETRGGVTRTISGGAGDDLSDARDREVVISPGIGSYGDTYRSNGSGSSSNRGNCVYASDTAADGSRCGGRASTERAGGQ
jgi:hypothetical protein